MSRQGFIGIGIFAGCVGFEADARVRPGIAYLGEVYTHLSNTLAIALAGHGRVQVAPHCAAFSRSTGGERALRAPFTVKTQGASTTPSCTSHMVSL